MRRPGAVADPTRWARHRRRGAPRWPSRHCTASGKRLCPSRLMPPLRRCAADRDLRGALERHLRVAERGAGRVSPTRERRPPRRRLVADSARADSTPDLGDRLANDRPTARTPSRSPRARSAGAAPRPAAPRSGSRRTRHTRSADTRSRPTWVDRRHRAARGPADRGSRGRGGRARRQRADSPRRTRRTIRAGRSLPRVAMQATS